jgi:hypothetical protein
MLLLVCLLKKRTCEPLIVANAASYTFMTNFRLFFYMAVNTVVSVFTAFTFFLNETIKRYGHNTVPGAACVKLQRLMLDTN